MVIFPDKLEFGDQVGLIAPGSTTIKPESIDLVVSYLRDHGFNVVEGRALRARKGYLAGDDKARARDLISMFGRKKVRGVFCLRGGYGVSRLLPFLDFKVIRDNPKCFVGFSDLTAFSIAALKLAGLSTFHGPTVYSLVSDDPVGFSWSKLWQALSTKQEISLIAEYPEAEREITILRKGLVRAPIIGGNLSILQTLIGTPWQISFRNKILFLEEISEPPFRIDRMLTHLLNAGAFAGVKGIAIGNCRDCIDPLASSVSEYRQTLLDVFKERLVPLKVPIVVGLPFGHTSFNATLPIAAMAALDANKGGLIIGARL